MPRMDRLSTYKTNVIAHDGRVAVTYVQTMIVEASGGRVRLNSDGWRSVTTKRKMNQAANQFDLGYSVYQRKGEWFVRVRGYTTDLMYFDGMTFFPV